MLLKSMIPLPKNNFPPIDKKYVAQTLMMIADGGNIRKKNAPPKEE